MASFRQISNMASSVLRKPCQITCESLTSTQKIALRENYYLFNTYKQLRIVFENGGIPPDAHEHLLERG